VDVAAAGRRRPAARRSAALDADVNPANLITLGRLLLVPVSVWLILAGHFGAAFWMFVVAGVSDAVDGFIAKRFDMRTRIGALLDPVADKTLLVSTYVTLGVAAQLPTWLVILVVSRDLMIVGGFLLVQLLSAETRWEPLMVSKANTALQIILVALTLARLAFAFDDHGLGILLVYAVAATTILSGAGYLVRWARSLAGAEPA
jgi:cardiolipin synthase (CMP-forming)